MSVPSGDCCTDVLSARLRYILTTKAKRHCRCLMRYDTLSKSVMTWWLLATDQIFN